MNGERYPLSHRSTQLKENRLSHTTKNTRPIFQTHSGVLRYHNGQLTVGVPIGHHLGGPQVSLEWSIRAQVASYEQLPVNRRVPGGLQRPGPAGGRLQP